MNKYFIFAIIVLHHNFLAINCADDEHERKLQMPGCEKHKDFADMEIKSCCASIPDLHHHEHFEKCMDCKSKQKGEKMCCCSDCMLKNAKLVNATGFLDIELVKEKLNEMVDKNTTWSEVINEVIADCLKQGPGMLQGWKASAPDHAPKCDTAINIVLKHCIRRNLFFKCPFKESSTKCDEYTEFGKSCKIFPILKVSKEIPKEKKEASESEYCKTLM